jgi:hypothetical protein
MLFVLLILIFFTIMKMLTLHVMSSTWCAKMGAALGHQRLGGTTTRAAA